MPIPFELAVDPATLALLALVAFVAGFIDAVAGGGGLLTIPALLMAGLPPHLVLGTNKLCATFGSATASYTFYRRKLFRPVPWRNALLGTAIGALLGAALAQWLPAAWLNQLLPAVVFACGLYLLFGQTPAAPTDGDAPVAQAGNGRKESAWVSTMVSRDRAPARSGRSAACCSIRWIWSAPAAWHGR